MKYTDEQLADFIGMALHFRNEAYGTRNVRSAQRKLRAQSKEINRLLEENRRLKELAHSRGRLIIEIQQRAMQKQVDGG